MAARSPRGSLSGASDIASDFEDSLKDLQRNDRFAIENLTNIARESTEHAQSISRVLETHIKKVRLLISRDNTLTTFRLAISTDIVSDRTQPKAASTIRA